MCVFEGETWRWVTRGCRHRLNSHTWPFYGNQNKGQKTGGTFVLKGVVKSHQLVYTLNTPSIVVWGLLWLARSQVIRY